MKPDFEFKVIIPSWWTDNGEYIEGFTDKIVNNRLYFPKAKKIEHIKPDCWDVYIPDYDYSGTFPVESLTLIAN